MKEYSEIAKELEQIAAENGYNVEANYEGVRGGIASALNLYLNAMFPAYCEHPVRESYYGDVRATYLRRANDALFLALRKMIPEEEAKTAVSTLCGCMPEIYKLLLSDVNAGYEGDPAATSVDEVIIAYPAFLAIGAYRIGHELYKQGYKLVARLMGEYAHSRTGIDIHPGAEIGKHFFIDHGTGGVIGETTVIGDNVKLYQHVTLGAKSFAAEEDGTLVKGIKRHPNIGNNVVIYAGATILGGDVYIGDDCVIGGNVWLTHSVPAGQTIYYKEV